jgi:hypothetical protein
LLTHSSRVIELSKLAIKLLKMGWALTFRQ